MSVTVAVAVAVVAEEHTPNPLAILLSRYTMGKIVFEVAPSSVLLPIGFTAVGLLLLYLGATEQEDWLTFGADGGGVEEPGGRGEL